MYLCLFVCLFSSLIVKNKCGFSTESEMEDIRNGESQEEKDENLKEKQKFQLGVKEEAEEQKEEDILFYKCND